MGDGEIRLEISIVSYGGFMRLGTEHYIFSQFGRRRLEWGFDIYHCPNEDGNYTKRWAFNAKIKLWDETAKPDFGIKCAWCLERFDSINLRGFG